MSNSLGNYIDYQLSKYDSLPESVKKEIEKVLRNTKSSLIGISLRCESPIEQMLAVHFMDLENHLYRELSVLSEFTSLVVSAQEEVVANARKYRVDFLINCIMKNKEHKFVIECDGHDFHEKTKEQVSRDKARERNLQKEGFTVIRFSGSEIWGSSISCIGEIVNIITKTVGLDDYYDNLFENEILADR